MNEMSNRYGGQFPSTQPSMAVAVSNAIEQERFLRSPCWLVFDGDGKPTAIHTFPDFKLSMLLDGWQARKSTWGEAIGAMKKVSST